MRSTPGVGTIVVVRMPIGGAPAETEDIRPAA